ncbi:MAG: NADH-quinone oxidoreductase subunit NuoK [Myxococcales bacterium]|nr:NADH-quinone oxidoreductase subunit NuoK [Myxococcales bacterium]
MSVFYDITVSHFLVLAAALFTVGIAGVLLRRNALIVMMSIELMLNAANITVLAFSRGFAGNNHEAAYQGQAFALTVIAIAAAEAAVGLAIVVTVFRTRRHSDIDRLTMLKN